MSEWYLSYGNEKIGPLTLEEAAARARKNPAGFAWREGFTEWLPIAHIAAFRGPEPGAPPPPPAPRAAAGKSAPRAADELDYHIVGSEMQFVEIELDPGETVIAEAGTMMYKDAFVEMRALFGDGSEQEGGFLGKLMTAGRRVLTGESLFVTAFTHTGASGKGRAAFAAPYPGNILPMSLASAGGTLICQKDSFLAAARGVSIGIFFQRRILTGLFGGEGFIMQKLEGDGMVFIHAGGTVVERALRPGEVLHVDTGCVVAFEPGVDFDIEKAGGIKTMLFGGEGLFFARLKGPGRVWLQSLPFSRLAGRMLMAAPGGGGRARGEGSILGGLGGLLDGDNI